MANSGMLICSFYLKERFCRGEENLYLLNGEHRTNSGEDEEKVYADVFSMLSEFCIENSDFSDDEKKAKLFSVSGDSVAYYDDGTNRAISFTIRSGSYGVESDVTDRHTKCVKYHRNVDDADIKDFQCLIYVPKDIGDTRIVKGIMIFQTIATYGVKTITVKRLTEFFAARALTLNTRSVSVRAFIEKLVEQGNLYKVTFIKNNVSPDDSDNMLISTGKEERSYIKPQLRPVVLQRILGFFERTSPSAIYEIDGNTFDDIRVEFSLGNHHRTVRLQFIDRLSVVEDFPDDIYNNGRCENANIIEYMLETANAYKS